MQIAGRDRLAVAGGGQQKRAALALVEPRRAYIRDGELPGIDNLPIQAAIRARSGHFQHGGAVLQVGEGRDVGGGAVGRDGLEMRGGRLGIGDDVVVFETQIVEGGAPEAVNSDRRHVPQDSLEGPLVLELVLKIFDRADGSRWRQATLGFTWLAGAMAQWCLQ